MLRTPDPMCDGDCTVARHHQGSAWICTASRRLDRGVSTAAYCLRDVDPDGIRYRTSRGQGDYQRLLGPGRHASG